MSCPCPQPVESPVPNNRGSCVKCGKRLEGAWLISSESLGELHDLLIAGRPIPDYQAARDHCERREVAGREKFGLRYLDRDNCAEALEEAADGINYSFFEEHRMRRGYHDPDVSAWLMNAAYYFAKAHHALREAMAAREGTPGASVDE